MRKMIIDELPKHNSGANKGKIDWGCSAGHKCNFIYDDIEGEIIITKVENRYIYFTYNGEEFRKGTGHFKNCEIADVIGKIQMEHRYNVGEIINDCEIIEQTKKLRGSGKFIRAYKVRCTKCGTIKEEKLESTLCKGGSCAVCASRATAKGINDIATTHPQFVKYFVNVKDAENNSYASNKKRLMKCPDCGNEQMCTPNYLVNSGFPCKRCSDGVSYPNKFMFNLLTQLELNFETEYSPEWIGRSRYDFYIPELSLIIEMDGEFHYTDNKMSNLTKCEVKNIDKYKEDMATSKGISTIRIDSRKSDIKYIANRIEASGLLEIINNNHVKVNWSECHKFACSSRVKEACDLWNSGIRSTGDIAKIMKLYPSTICTYLKNGKYCGMCDYDSKEAMIESGKRVSSKRIYVKKDKGIPMSIIKDAERENVKRSICRDYANGKSLQDISVDYNYSITTITKFLISGRNNGWCNYDTTENNKKRLNEMQQNNKKSVLVYKDGKFIGEYESASEIDNKSIDDFGDKLDFRNISAVCVGKRNSYKGYVFKFK